MPFDFFSDAGSFSDFADFGDVGSIVDDFGAEFITADFSFTDFDIPVADVSGLGGWTEVGSFAGNSDWFDTFNSGSILDSASSIGDSISSSATGFFDSISNSLPSLDSIKDVASGVAKDVSGFIDSAKAALPSLDKIKSVASTVAKDVQGYVKTAQSAIASYQKVAPAVNAAAAALGVQNPITQFIQPLSAAVNVAGSAASGVASAAAPSNSGSSWNLFGPSQSDRAESYNQAKSTVESTDAALKTYEADRQASTEEILRASDNISSIRSKIDDPNTSEEERAIAEEQLKTQYDQLAVAQKSLEQTNAATEQVTAARNSAAKIVAGADANTIKNAAYIETKQQITDYNQAVSTVDSTSKALKQYDTDKALATQDILRTSDNINTIQSKIDDPNTSAEERAIAEAQLKTQYDQLALAQKSLEQTNEAAAAVTAARDQAAQVVANTNLNTIKTPFQVDQYGLVILDAKATAELEKNIKPGFVNSFVDPGTGTSPSNESYSQAKETVASTNAALKQYEVDRQAATKDILAASDNIANINARLDNPLTPPDEKLLLEEQRKAEYDKLAVAKQSLEQTNAATEAVTTARDEAAKVVANGDATATAQAAAVAGAGASQYQMVKNPNDTYTVVNRQTGVIVGSDLSIAEAARAAQQFGIISPAVATTASAAAVVAGAVSLGSITVSQLAQFLDPNAQQNATTAALANTARAQQSIRSLRNNKAQSGDWRVRLRLAPNSTYLYNDGQPGILQPLRITDGVIFPYTPSIETAYKANYDAYDLTHSNYRGYFYKNSYVDAVNIRATFTAQDTKEADYLLAVIHFFRSCTKMFYANDPQKGSPPPLVYLSGYGDYQFNEHPSVVSQFNYTLPPDVDYIRCQSTLSNNTNLLNSRLRNPIANNPLAYSVNRLLNSSLFQGALNNSPLAPTNSLDSAGPTYVPTKMEISISLLPTQSRSNISNNFSVKGFANGNLLKGGFW